MAELNEGKTMWALWFRRDGELVGIAVIEAPSLYHARMRAAFGGIGKPFDYSEGAELNADHAALVPQDWIGKLLSPKESQAISDWMRAPPTAPAA